MRYVLKNEHEDKYIIYLKKRYGEKRATSFLNTKTFSNN